MGFVLLEAGEQLHGAYLPTAQVILVGNGAVVDKCHVGSILILGVLENCQITNNIVRDGVKRISTISYLKLLNYIEEHNLHEK